VVPKRLDSHQSNSCWRSHGMKKNDSVSAGSGRLACQSKLVSSFPLHRLGIGCLHLSVGEASGTGIAPPQTTTRHCFTSLDRIRVQSQFQAARAVVQWRRDVLEQLPSFSIAFARLSFDRRHSFVVNFCRSRTSRQTCRTEFGCL